ncbi:deaminase [Tessaracoccus aquimaris]|uniref:Deaminase n=1 Tax=Tessaracoccus aquimaris TaxID=1332264 RepID=A0A1Q2CMQ1_9ACTN|nr:dihydrofolate reductase family protein [Tessaracoccus aquimaris]AQP47398.1 deaminase [Tessaracoccus aquimaris]
MRDVVYSMSMSLDGYIVGPDGRFDWSVPGPEAFRAATQEVRGVGVHLLGRRLYETMVYWEHDDPTWEADEVEFAAIWRALPKVVFSDTLRKVEGNTRLAQWPLAEEIARLRSEPGGEIAIGGADLAADAADLGLIDEYRLRIFPVLVGGGIPFFARHERRQDLRLVEQATLDDSIAYLRYRVA